MTGSKKAAVLPDPVCAQAIRSRPAATMANEYFCTGVGTVYLVRKTFSMRLLWNLASAKVLTQGGTASPVTLTGMFSYFEKLIPVLWISLKTSVSLLVSICFSCTENVAWVYSSVGSSGL